MEVSAARKRPYAFSALQVAETHSGGRDHAAARRGTVPGMGAAACHSPLLRP